MVLSLWRALRLSAVIIPDRRFNRRPIVKRKEGGIEGLLSHGAKAVRVCALFYFFLSFSFLSGILPLFPTKDIVLVERL